MSESPPKTMTPKLQLLGRALVLQLHMVLRTMRIHDPNNRALLVATENLRETINTLWAVLHGVVRLQFVEGVVYLNDLRVRLDGLAREQVDFLQAEFERRGLGGLGFSRPVDTASLREFLSAFSRPIESKEDVQQMKESLHQMKDLALELLGPKAFSENAREEQELHVDRKTFALQTYAKSIVAVRDFVSAMQADKPESGGRLRLLRIVQDLVDIAAERVNFLIKLAAIKTAHDYPYNHAANTCVISIVLGKALGIERLALVDLGLAALLADVAFALLPPELLDRERELSEAERLEVHDCMVRQVRSLLGDGQITRGLIHRIVVAYEHHRPYFDPATRRRGQSHIFSRIVAVADAFDALTTRRPWREGYAPDEALRILVKQAGTQYDPVVVRVLVNLMGLYPLGTVVRLESGEVGIVYHNSNRPEAYDKPWIRLVLDASGASVKRTTIIDLSAEQARDAGTQRRITEVLRASEIEGFDPGMAIVV
ncbi:MAG: hypothetical protein IPK13_07980 [Deltaproteobacteria bacterium]|nr:hypothetical protein [Deltaproteobacteria bacterium]